MTALIACMNPVRAFGAGTHARRLFAVFSFLLCLLPTKISLGAPSTGSVIENQASARFAVAGQVVDVQSNTVRAVVQTVESAQLDQNQSVSRAPGSTIHLAHRLRNTGNATSVFAVSVSNVSGGGFGFTGLRVVQDINGNGVADAGESTITSVSLASGEAVDLVVSALIPAGAQATQAARLQLSAQSGLQNVQVSNIDTVTVVAGALLLPGLATSNPTPATDEIVSLRYVTTNSGASATAAALLTVDGQAVSRVLLRQFVPTGTSFSALQCPANTMPLYHLVGTPALTFTAVAPVDPTRVVEVACAAANLGVGESTSFTLRVRMEVATSGTVTAVGDAVYGDGLSVAPMITPTNELRMQVAGTPNRIRFYRDTTFTQKARRSDLGQPLHIQTNAPACNRDPQVAETLVLWVVSSLTGDNESFIATESGPNTNLFRVYSVATAEGQANSGDGRIQALKNDTLTTWFRACGQPVAMDTVLVDPYGVVFDSRSNAPVAGATVQLIDVSGNANGGLPGGAARVFGEDGVTPAPATVTTGADGAFQFPLVGESTYRLLVTAPPSYRFASATPAGSLPSGRTIDISGSYGGPFAVNAATGAVRVDIPVDFLGSGGLLLEKTASRGVAEIGDFVDYTVQVKNLAGAAIGGVRVADSLPAGFAYVPGSTRRDGQSVADPSGGRGPQLSFAVGDLADGATTKIVYRLRIGPGAGLGDGINRAQATSALPTILASNIGAARVKVEGGVFGDRGFILGKVFADCSRNGVQDAGEPGVPGVRVWLEDGSFAVTDGEGKFSFYGVSPRTHVAKVDPITLPAGARLMPLNQRNAGDGDSRFVDMKNGELARADFAIEGCGDTIRAEIERRRAASSVRPSEIGTGLAKSLTLDAVPAIDPRSLPAAGTVGSAANGTGQSQTPASAAPIAPQSAPATPANESMPALGELAETLDNRPAFLDLQDRAVVDSRQIRVRIKGMAGAPLTLKVNDQPVAESRVGTRVQREDRQLELREYVGIELKAGENRLLLEQHDPFGNLRASQTLTLIAPGDLHRIRVSFPKSPASADGSTAAAVVVTLEDERGHPVTSRTALTLESSLGQWLVEDLNKIEPGVQVFVEGGRAEFSLRSPEQPGEAAVRVSSGRIVADARLVFAPSLRDLIAAGVIEGAINVRRFNASALLPARKQDGFEQELRNFTRGNASARAALFLKGRIKGDYLLTLGYDSEKETRERMFRDIQPDQFYPVYGDASVRGFDAQSTSRLYVRVDKNKSWLLYGDFTTPAATPARNLTAYNRSLTGIREHYESGNLVVNAFASRDSTRQVVLEIPANGTSGPFLLNNTNLIVNSEKVELVTRDRNQPALVLKTVPQARFSDYEIESFAGRLLFRGPVPSLDANLNPNFIRITYEVDQGGTNFWTAGADVSLKITDKLEIGAVAIGDRNPQDPASLTGANVTWKSGPTTVIAEVASSDRLSVGKGRAERFEVRHDDGNLQARVHAGRSDTTFDNPSAGLSKGREEAGARVSYKIDERTRIVAEAIRTGDAASGAHREGVLAGVERGFDHNIKAEAGVRATRDTAAPTAGGTTGVTSETLSMRAKVSAPLPNAPQATVFGEVEQAIGDSGRRLAAVGGDYRFSEKGRIYGRHEFISSLSGPYALDSAQRRATTLVGMDTEYMKDGRAFSEYRVRDAMSGRDAEAAIGLKNQWRVSEGLRLNTGFERVHALSGSHEREATALTGGIDYTASERLKTTARLELRTSPGTDSVLSTVGVALKLSDDWTFLGRNIFNLVESKAPGGGNRLQDRLQLGFAYRDSATNVWNGLGRYEYKIESDGTPGSDYRRAAHIVSTHVNVQPSRFMVFTARYAAKFALEQSAGITSRSTNHLVAGRVTRDFGERWDVSLQASALVSGDLRAFQGGLGAEIGYRVMNNLWLAGGYNLFGFRDRDLSGDDSTQKGLFVRMRYKFDEKIFGSL